MKRENWLKEQEEFSDKLLTKEDKELFEILFNEMGEEKGITVPMGFAEKVAVKQIRKDTFWRDIKLYAFYATLFVALMGISFVVFSLDSSGISTGNLKTISTYLSYTVVAAFGYFCIQTLDRALVNKNGII